MQKKELFKSNTKLADFQFFRINNLQNALFLPQNQ